MFTNLPHLIQILQGISWIPFTALCAVFGYAAVRWIGNTFFPERYVTLKRFHNDKLISTVQIDVKSAETLVEQLRKIREAERGR